MSLTYMREITLILLECGKCGIQFGVPEKFNTERINDGGDWYCPNGHCRVYKEPEVEKLRKRLRTEEARRVAAEDQRQAAERQAIAYKGHVTRLKTRAAAGVCPCCNRSFENLRRHMTAKHPDFTKEATDG